MGRTSRDRYIIGALILALLAAALVPLGVLASRWIYLGPDSQPADFRALYNEHALRTAGATLDENTWPLFEQILSLLAEVDGAVPDPRGTGAIRYDAALNPDTSEIERQRARDALDLLESRGMFDMLDRLAENPAAARLFAASETSMWESLDSSSAARHLARMLVLRLRLALREGDSEQSVRSVRHAMAAARILGQQPTIIDRLVAIAIVACVDGALLHEVLARRPDEPTLRAFIHELQKPVLPPLADAFEGDRLISQEMLHRTLSPNSPIRAINRGAQMARHDQFHALVAQYISQPRQERDAELARQINALANRPGSPALGMVLPAVEQVIRSDDIALSMHHGTITLLAVETCIASTGAPPAALEGMAPAILSVLPPDPFSADAAFRYVLQDPGQDPHGRRYLLYSVGLDGQDDGGQPAVPAMNAYTGRAPATDYIFNAPPE
jgi:hypothetical protein